MGGTKTALALSDRRGRVLARAVHPTPKLPPKKAVPLLIRQLDELRPSLGSRPPRVGAIGIGIPGLSNPATGELVWAPNLWSTDGKGCRKVPLGPQLKRYFHCPVTVENDADMALLAEAWRGRAVGLKNAVMMTVGTGVGGAILFDGKLLQGAGAVGWIRVMGGECMENIASGPAILGRFLRVSRDRWPFEGEPNTPRVCQAAREGNLRAKKVLREAALALGWASAGMVSVLNPETVIFGGGVMDSSAGSLLPLIRSEIKRLAQPTAASRARVLHSKLGNDAGWMGGLAAALRMFPPAGRVS